MRDQVSLPDLAGRKEILESIFRRWPLPLTGVSIGEIAEETEGMSGADLHELCRKAASAVVKVARVTWANLLPFASPIQNTNCFF